MYAITELLLERIVMFLPMLNRTLFLTLLLASGSALAEWQLIAINDQDSMFYIDPATIRKDGNMRTFWRKSEFKSRGNTGSMSTRAKIEIDCKKEAYRFFAVTGFAESNLSGRMFFSTDFPNDPFIAIAPDTIDSTFMQRVCK
jgi:hypothetical protein